MPSLQTVNVADIRSELRKIWASEVMRDETVIRAQTHNLIVYTEGDDDALNETVERLIQVTSERPGRVIVIHNDPEETHDSVDAGITAFCRMINSRQLCGELVMLSVTGAVRDEIHSTAVALLAPSLPVYLWWDADLDTNDHLFEHLVSEVDLLLVDSNRQPLDVLGSLDVRIGDLNWSRLTPHRRLLARFWDLRDLREALYHIEKLDVHHTGSTSRALLLVGWLASSLGWRLRSVEADDVPDGYIVHWQSDDYGLVDVKVEVVTNTDDRYQPGEVTGVFIHAGENPPYVMPRLEVNPADHCIEVRQDDSTPGRLYHRFHYDPVTLAHALADEIDYGYDPEYMNALHTALEILDQA